MPPEVTIHYRDGDREFKLPARKGDNLREVLLAHGHSPYTQITRKLNCGGRGICATCGVWIVDEEVPAPAHWHDKLAHRFGYPRLSCQVTVEKDMTVVRVPDKWIWGGRRNQPKGGK